MANAVAEVELDNGRSAEIYIAADYEYENSLITVNGEDAIPYERYTARLNRVISALLVEGYKVEFDYYTTEEG